MAKIILLNRARASGFFLCCSLLFPFVTSAINHNTPEACTEVDLSAELGPTQNQGSIGWCTSYAASEVISFHLGTKVSAPLMAIKYNMSEQREKDFKDHVNSLPEFCKSRFVNPEVPTRLEGTTPYFKSLVSSQSDLFCPVNQNSETIEKQMRGSDFAYYFRKATLPPASKDYDERCQSLKKLVPGISEELYKKIIETGVSDLKNFIDTVVCPNPIRGKLSVVDSAIPFVPNPKKELGHIKKSLVGSLVAEAGDGKPSLFAMDLNQIEKKPTLSERLSDRIYDVLHPEPPAAKDPCQLGGQNAKILAHTMVVAGRKFNSVSKKCELLIKNSWGRLCSAGFKESKVTCVVDKDKNETGYFYIPADNLEKSILSVAKIEIER